MLWEGRGKGYNCCIGFVWDFVDLSRSDSIPRHGPKNKTSFAYVNVVVAVTVCTTSRRPGLKCTTPHHTLSPSPGTQCKQTVSQGVGGTNGRVASVATTIYELLNAACRENKQKELSAREVDQGVPYMIAGEQ